MRGRDEGGRDDQGTKGLEDQGTRGPKKENKEKNPKINTSPDVSRSFWCREDMVGILMRDLDFVVASL